MSDDPGDRSAPPSEGGRARRVPGAPFAADPPVFVGRDAYRRRRVMDAAKLLPAFGLVLMLMPILWASDRGTASGLVYLFVVWFGLILIAAVLSYRLSEPLRDPGAGDAARPPDGEAR